MKIFPIIDYSRHPAFSKFGVKNEAISNWLEKKLNELDFLIDEFYESSKSKSLDGIKKFVEEKFVPREKEIITYFDQYFEGPSNLKNWLKESTIKTFAKLNQELIFKAFKKFNSDTKCNKEAQRVYEELKKNGVCCSNIPKEDINKIKKFLSPYIDALHKKREKSPNSRCVVPLPLRSTPWNIIMKYFDKVGFNEGGSKYYGYQIQPMGFGLEISHHQQDWWKNCYKDIGIPTTKTVYMHNDYDLDYIKAMVYLDEVNEDNGAFSYIKGSHSWKRERSLTYMNKEIEDILRNHPDICESDTSAYYRKVMKTSIGRELFAMLPKVLQRPSHFGDDILDDTPLSNELLKNEFWATSDKGNFVLFTGGDGIHRGGNVIKNERKAIQITISKNPNLSKQLKKMARDLIGNSLSTLIGEKRVIAFNKKTGQSI